MDTKRDKDNLEKFFRKGKFFEKKILITGGTGFIGYHLAKKCVRMMGSYQFFKKKTKIYKNT